MQGRAAEAGRSDDTPEAMRVRLEKQKPPAELLEHYRRAGKLKDVDGRPGVDEVTAAVAEALGIERAAWKASR
jgi:adenylate kinase family enzyme